MQRKLKSLLARQLVNRRVETAVVARQIIIVVSDLLSHVPLAEEEHQTVADAGHGHQMTGGAPGHQTAGDVPALQMLDAVLGPQIVAAGPGLQTAGDAHVLPTADEDQGHQTAGEDQGLQIADEGQGHLKDGAVLGHQRDALVVVLRTGIDPYPQNILMAGPWTGGGPGHLMTMLDIHQIINDGHDLLIDVDCHVHRIIEDYRARLTTGGCHALQMLDLAQRNNTDLHGHWIVAHAHQNIIIPTLLGPIICGQGHRIIYDLTRQGAT